MDDFPPHEDMATYIEWARGFSALFLFTETREQAQEIRKNLDDCLSANSGIPTELIQLETRSADDDRPSPDTPPPTVEKNLYFIMQKRRSPTSGPLWVDLFHGDQEKQAKNCTCFFNILNQNRWVLETEVRLPMIFSVPTREKDVVRFHAADIFAVRSWSADMSQRPLSKPVSGKPFVPQNR